MKKNAKALSPVVASIILIAVTVAVSIAVAAWMGALVVGQMDTEQLKVTSAQYTTSGTVDVIVLSVSNTGTSSVTISDAYVNNALQSNVTYTTSATVVANGQVTVTIAYDWASGDNYQMKLVTSAGNNFLYTAIAPA